MTRSITSKELRTKFPWVKEEAGKGTKFIVYYRSKPVLKVETFSEELPEKSDRPVWQDWLYWKQEVMKDIERDRLKAKKEKLKPWKGWNRLITHTKDRKRFSAVDLIREDREET